MTTALLAAAGQPYDVMGATGKVLGSGRVGEWVTITRTGTAVNACVDLPDGSLMLFRMPMEGVEEGEQVRSE